MSFDIYVGNYPREFSREDVEDLFFEYKDIQLKKFFKKDNKCFSFLTCKNIDQALSVIEQKHNLNVGGRRLIVRASDYDSQSCIELLLQEKKKETNSRNHLSLPTKINKSETFGENKSEYKNYYHFRSSHAQKEEIDCKKDISLGQVHKNNPILQKANKNNMCNQNKFSHKDNHFEKPHGSKYHSDSRHEPIYHQNFDKSQCKLNYKDFSFFNQESFDRKSPYKRIHERETKKDIPFEPLPAMKHETLNQETFIDKTQHFKNVPHYYPSSYHSSVDESESINSYTSDRIEKGASSSQTSNIELETSEEILDEFGWVSVSNFPLGTTISDFYELFVDFCPLKVFIRYDLPEIEDQLTEAFVCFSDKDVACDVILNFDNTIYHGQVILVNDMEDLTIMNELMTVIHA